MADDQPPASPPAEVPKPTDPTQKPVAEMAAPTGAATAPPGPPPIRRSYWDRMRLRAAPSGSARLLAGLVCVVLIIGAWALITTGRAEDRVVSPTVLPSPMETVAAFPSLWFDAALTRNL